MKFNTSTVEDRHEVYKAMLAEIDAPEKQYLGGQSSCTYGFCFLLTVIGCYFDIWDLVELYRSQPKSLRFFDIYWFIPGKWEERREILVQCIEETKPKSDGTTHIQIHSSGEDN